MPRMPELQPHEFDETTRKLGEEIAKTRGGAINGPWAHMLRNPELAQRAAAYSDYFRDGVSVPRKLALIGVIMTARHWNAEYVWNAQAPQAKAAGVSEALIEAIRTKQTPTIGDAAEQTVYNLFREMHDKHSVSDATYDAAEKLLGQKGLIELLNVAGFYGIIASMVCVTGIPVRPGQARPFQ